MRRMDEDVDNWYINQFKIFLVHRPPALILRFILDNLNSQCLQVWVNKYFDTAVNFGEPNMDETWNHVSSTLINNWKLLPKLKENFKI